MYCESRPDHHCEKRVRRYNWELGARGGHKNLGKKNGPGGAEDTIFQGAEINELFRTNHDSPQQHLDAKTGDYFDILHPIRGSGDCTRNPHPIPVGMRRRLDRSGHARGSPDRLPPEGRTEPPPSEAYQEGRRWRRRRLCQKTRPPSSPGTDANSHVLPNIRTHRHSQRSPHHDDLAPHTSRTRIRPSIQRRVQHSPPNVRRRIRSAMDGAR
mmetsp:Transcript_5567/g.13917  ORF Transcript_5567/g.13917 Transcript_5567/m.13917 type:complete len:212 (-) Transcript_5567:2139-2774(-)